MAANPMKLELNKKTIAEKTPKIDPKVMTEIELNDASITDDDLKLFAQLLPKNANITDISINAHNLKAISYDVCLTLLKSFPTITSFYLAAIRPRNLVASQYYAAMNRVIEKNKKLSEEKKQKLVTTVPVEVQKAEVSARSADQLKKMSLENAYTAANPMKLELNKKTIAEKTPKIDPKVMTEIELNDASITDDDLKLFAQLLPKNANITGISINVHSLSAKSYDVCLTLLKSFPTITSFGLAPIHPINALGSQYYEAIHQLVERNLKLLEGKKQALVPVVPLEVQKAVAAEPILSQKTAAPQDVYTAVNPTKLELNKKTIAEKTPKIDPKAMTEIELNDASLTDDDLKLFIQLLPKNANITGISIKAHSLTAKSYDVCLTLLKSFSNITSFYLAPICPIDAFGSEYKGAMNRLVEMNRKLSEEKKQKLASEGSLKAQKEQGQAPVSVPPQKGVERPHPLLMFRLHSLTPSPSGSESPASNGHAAHRTSQSCVALAGFNRDENTSNGPKKANLPKTAPVISTH